MVGSAAKDRSGQYAAGDAGKDWQQQQKVHFEDPTSRFHRTDGGMA
jgi:hypothetical protein